MILTMLRLWYIEPCPQPIPGLLDHALNRTHICIHTSNVTNLGSNHWNKILPLRQSSNMAHDVMPTSTNSGILARALPPALTKSMTSGTFYWVLTHALQLACTISYQTWMMHSHRHLPFHDPRSTPLGHGLCCNTDIYTIDESRYSSLGFGSCSSTGMYHFMTLSTTH